MTLNNKKVQMPGWLGILLMPVMIVFSGIALVAYVTTMSFTVLAIQIAGVFAAIFSFVHRASPRTAEKLSN